MNTLFEQPVEAQESNARCQALLAQILAQIPAARENAKLIGKQELYQDPAHQGRLFLLKEGALSYSRNGRVLFFYDVGDLIGLEHCFGGSGGKICTDFAVIVDEYRAEDVLSHVQADAELLRHWSAFLIGQLSLFRSICGGLVKEEMKAVPNIKNFSPGDVIIEQGGKDTDVYTLLDGHADVLVDNVEVGEIEAEEMFGVIAALRGASRTATVVATRPSTTLTLPSSAFVELIEARPTTVLRLVEGMSNKIVALNERVVGPTHGAE